MAFPKVGFVKSAAVSWTRPKPPQTQSKLPNIPKVSAPTHSLGRVPPRKEDPYTVSKRFRKTPPKSWTGGDKRQAHSQENPKIESPTIEEPLPNPEYQNYQQPRERAVLGPRYDPMAFRGDMDEYEERAPQTIFGSSFEQLLKEDYVERKTVNDYDGVVGKYPDDYIGKPYTDPPIEKPKESFWVRFDFIKKIQSELVEDPEIRMIQFFPASVFWRSRAIMDIDEM